MSSVITRFVERLRKIGIEVTLIGNVPWVYLSEINGEPVKGTLQANHGFTAFYTATKPDTEDRFSDRREVFKKVREMVGKTDK